MTGESTSTSIKPREKWRSKVDFFFGLAGGSVGLGNVWRFPYLCYKNGGGAFLIPYLIFLLVSALPIFFLEVTLGQFTSRGVARAWEMVPIMKGIGYASTVIIVNLNTYYMTVLAWGLRYMVASFSATLPWSTCDNEWNTENCFDFENWNKTSNLGNLSTTQSPLYPTVEPGNWISTTGNTSSGKNESVRVSSVVEFWERGVLGLSSGVHELGSVQWELLLCMLVGWIVVYFCIWRGIAWTSKVVYFTATFPLLMLFILFVRGITLDGAIDGIEFYLKPNATKLKEPQVWADAATQVFYSYSLCNGILVALGSYNTYHHNTYRDTILLAVLNSGTSFFSGFAVFSVLGYMAKEQNVNIDSVAESGPGLVFIAYPRAISLLPLPQLWGVLFFLMLFFLGLDSQFVGQESFMTSLIDMRPRFFQKPWRREMVVAVVCGVQFLIGILMVTQGGVYIFNMYDNYAAAGWCLFFIGICECVTISWLFGINKYWDRVIHMLGFKPRIPWFKWCWVFVAPTSTLAVFLYSLIKYTPLSYNKIYIYPLWAQFLAWCLALCAILWIPGYAIYAIWNAKGSLSERWKAVTKMPAAIEKRLYGMDPKDDIDEKPSQAGVLIDDNDKEDECEVPEYSSIRL
ncbi:sodium- and chloride-dependent GABA transporter 2-like [Styela clava]